MLVNTLRRTEEQHICTLHAAISSFFWRGVGLMLVSMITHERLQVTFDLLVSEQGQLGMNIMTGDMTTIQRLSGSS